ncbi:MAG TPA: FAD-dependent oxidoreductase [Candidatus Bathyarchaeia archaeon]|nr:FAD-dependent oxidoreductase [Candidatus Bathyarchaeia archaeon]
MPQPDVCILGGGIMGSATAYWISKMSDLKVVLLDRFGVGNERSSSNDINRVFRYSYGRDELYTQMAVQSLELWRNLEKESAQQLLINSGLLLVQGEDKIANSFNEASYQTLIKMGLGAEQLGKEELQKRFPQFKAEAGYFDPHGGVLLASKALATFTSQAQSRGVRFVRSEARAISATDHPIVDADGDKPVSLRKLVITIGPWSNRFLKSRLPKMSPTRQQLIYLRPRKTIDNFRPGKFPVFFTDEHYGLPAAGIDAVKVSPKELQEEVDVDSASRLVDEEEVDSCRKVCREYIPDLANGDVVHSKICFYDMTANSDFVIDHDPDNLDIVYGYGFSGHGFKFAPLIGKLLAELALGEEPSFDITRFSAVASNRLTGKTGPLGQGE